MPLCNFLIIGIYPLLIVNRQRMVFFQGKDRHPSLEK